MAQFILVRYKTNVRRNGYSVQNQLEKDLSDSYGELAAPRYSFAMQRLEAGMHENFVRKLARQFFVSDQTSLGSDDVCITLLARLREADAAWRWCIQLSLVGKYALVGAMADRLERWPVLEPAIDHDEARLLHSLRDDGFELLTYDVLRTPTGLRPPNWESDEVCTVYNALFTFMTPWPLQSQRPARHG